MAPKRRVPPSTEGRTKRVRFDEPIKPVELDFDEGVEGFQTRKSRERRELAQMREAEDLLANESDEEEAEDIRAKRMRKVKTDEFEQGKSYGDGEMGEGSFALDRSGRVKEVEGEEDMHLDHAHDDSEQQFEPFNLKEEMVTGYFDSSGTYIENKVEEEEDDPWLKSFGTENVKGDTAAALNPTVDEQELMDKEQQRINLENISQEKQDPRPHLETLYRLTEPSETPLMAIRRWKKLDGAEEMDRLTDASEVLLGGGYYGVYEDTREKFAQLLNIKWEIKWGDATEVHGPFQNSEMVMWQEQGYFNGKTRPYVRLNGKGEWEEGWTKRY